MQTVFLCACNKCIMLYFFREFKIRLRRDTELFADDFVAENVDFDPAKVVTGDVKGNYELFKSCMYIVCFTF